MSARRNSAVFVFLGGLGCGAWPSGSHQPHMISGYERVSAYLLIFSFLFSMKLMPFKSKIKLATPGSLLP